MADLILILILIAFSYHGWKKGFIKTLIDLTSTLISLVLSMILYNPISSFIKESPLGELVREKTYSFMEMSLENGEKLLLTDSAVESASSVVIYAISFIAIIIISKILIVVLAKVLDIASKFPVIKQANKILGTAVGLLSGLLICYIAVGVMSNFTTSDTIIKVVENIESSMLAVKLYENNIVSDILTAVIK